MEMFLMVLCIGLFGLAVTAMAFNAAAPPQGDAPAAQPEIKPALETAPARFFAVGLKPPPIIQPQVPIEALLLQIDNHVRLEQAAAESFLQHPSADLLHSRTISTLVH